jgi:hypothetical protein
MKRSPFIFLAVFFVSALTAFPQGSYLKRGQYGLGLSGVYVSNSDVSGFSGTAGISLGGLFDLTFSTGRATYAIAEFSSLKSTTFAPGITAYVVKQEASKSPVTLSISAGYAMDDFSSPDLDEGALTMRSKSFIVGAAVYRDVRLFRAAYLQPYAGLTYTDTTSKLSNAAGVTFRSTDNQLTFEFGLPFVYELFSDVTMVVVQPSLGFDKNITFAFSVGLVFALPQPKK